MTHPLLPRTLEPEVMDTQEEVAEYLAMDHLAVNEKFIEDLYAGGPVGDRVMDLGCGTAQIPVLLCQKSLDIQVLAVDSSVEMLETARLEVEMGGVVGQVQLAHADSKTMTEYESESIQTVISNSLIHHLPDPLPALRQMNRLIEPGGRLFVRDLSRPDSEDEVESLVQQYAGEESAFAQQLLRQSLHAALTLGEVQELAAEVGIRADSIRMTSDRHWTIDWMK
ncbi:MAG: methyltransferase domain-containing protein [Planctomycetota bacterium]